MKDNSSVVSLLDIIATVLLVCGIISSFVLAYFFGRTLTVGIIKDFYERSWPLTIGIFLGCIFGSLLQYAVLEGLSHILQTIDEIKKSTKQGADITMRQEADRQHEKKLETGEEWKCKRCGRIHPRQATSCICGQRRYENQE